MACKLIVSSIFLYQQVYVDIAEASAYAYAQGVADAETFFRCSEVHQVAPHRTDCAIRLMDKKDGVAQHVAHFALGLHGNAVSSWLQGFQALPIGNA